MKQVTNIGKSIKMKLWNLAADLKRDKNDNQMYHTTIDASEEDFKIDVATLEATNMRSTSAVLRGKITQGQFFDNPYFKTLGFVYSTNQSDINNTSNMGGTYVQPSSIGEEFEAEVTGLTPETTYYFRAVAKSSLGDTYGEIHSFKTPETEKFFGHDFNLPSGLLWCHSFVGQDETGSGTVTHHVSHRRVH